MDVKEDLGRGSAVEDTMSGKVNTVVDEADEEADTMIVAKEDVETIVVEADKSGESQFPLVCGLFGVDEEKVHQHFTS